MSAIQRSALLQSPACCAQPCCICVLLALWQRMHHATQAWRRCLRLGHRGTQHTERSLRSTWRLQHGSPLSGTKPYKPEEYCPHLCGRRPQRSRRQPRCSPNLACSTQGMRSDDVLPTGARPWAQRLLPAVHAAVRVHHGEQVPAQPGCGCTTHPPVRHAPHSFRAG